MPKPVLSDSLFNADDVATAVLAEANLQVANSDLGVTDISSSFSLETSLWSPMEPVKAFHFNGFVFVMASAYATASTLASSETVYTITNSDYYPSHIVIFPTVSQQADTATFMQIQANSSALKVVNVYNQGDGFFRIAMNGFYRVN